MPFVRYKICFYCKIYMFFDLAAFIPLLKHLKRVVFCIIVTLSQEMAIYRNVNTSIMYSFSLAAVTNYYKYSSLNNPGLSFFSVGRKSDSVLMRLLSRLWCGYIPLRATFPCLFCFPKSTCISGLTTLSPSSKPAMLYLSDQYSMVTSPSNSLIPLLSSTFKDIVITLGWPC